MIFNFLNFGKKEEKQNIEVSKIFNSGNLKKKKNEIEKFPKLKILET